MSERRAIVIDTDPGQDDAAAILLALACPDALDVRAITAVAGNIPLAIAERNARAIVELSARIEVPVHAGAAAPWLRTLVTAEHICGPSGLDGADLPPPRLQLASAHAVDAITEILGGAPDAGVTLCPIGPLTNIATALVKAPKLVSRIREIVLMGGAIGLGNITPAAEFNIHVDPHAAAAVFRSGARIVMLPLDATHQAIATPDWAKRLAALGTRSGTAIAGMFGQKTKRNLARFDGRGVPLHDPCVIAYLLWPELFQGTRCYVEVETASELTMGRTVVDRWNALHKPPNALVIERVDADRLFERMTERLRALP
jgi:purine nucleosidase